MQATMPDALGLLEEQLSDSNVVRIRRDGGDWIVDYCHDKDWHRAVVFDCHGQVREQTVWLASALIEVLMMKGVNND